MASSLTINNIVKSYGEKAVLNGISFHAKQGEFIVLVGPSGCGKSTMLRSIAGLEKVNEGSILIGDRDVTALPPKSRDIAMVFQDYALYPHKNVYENIAFGLRIRNVSQTEIDRLVKEAAEKLDLMPYLSRKPAALSGGQRQRVAIGRAIVRNPHVFLFDEPLSNLDAKLRGSMRLTIAKLHKELGATSVYVTHDQVEAMTLADRIIVLEAGKIQQVGVPLELYYHPVNIFVATFIGSPSMNLMHGDLRLEQERLWFISDLGLRFAVPSEYAPSLQNYAGKRVIWGVRPENLRLFDSVSEPEEANQYHAKVIVTELLGPTSVVLCEIQGHEMQVVLPAPHRPTRGEELTLCYKSKHLYMFDETTHQAIVPYQKHGK